MFSPASLFTKGVSSYYLMLVILRFVLIFIPQTGYIHPDEFFQSPEIVFGDLLKLKHFRPWEFTGDNPIRSVVFPYIIIGIPALILRAFGGLYLIGTRFYPYCLLVLPRVIMFFVSFIHDLCIYKLFKLMDKNPFHALVVFSSSYVSLVYLTRTLSNSLEAACVTVLIYVVAREIITQKFGKTPARIDERTYYLFGVLISIGCFIRPTFCLFALMPMLYFVFFCSSSRFFMIIKSLHFSIGLSASSLVLAFIDTAYYRKDIKGMIQPLNITTTLQDLIFTPLNFVQYNMNTGNLAEHGYHPHYLHSVVNVPLTFSLLGMYGFASGIKIMIQAYKQLNECTSFLRLFYFISFIAPLCLLSAFPHQEPRFLIPLMFPLICYCAEHMYVNLVRSKFTLFLWLLTNLMGVMFFGFFHQGGMYSVMNYFHLSLSKTMPTGQDIIFFHTYMPPRHLMGLKERRHRGVRIHDFAGASDPDVYHLVHSIMQESDPRNKSYLVVPSSVTISLVNLNVLLSPTHQLKLEKKFFPHLSIEDLPVLHNIWNVITSRSSFSFKMRKLKDFFTLNIYRSDPIVKQSFK